MKIIQSFAKFEEGNPYIVDNQDKEILNFYSFLLSYITLKENCGNVTMYCNNSAYESLIKYIPYDNVEIIENRYDFRYWSLYKVDMMRRVSGKLLHVDSDVFIFEKNFMNLFKGKWDLVIQNVQYDHIESTKSFVDNNLSYLQNSLNLKLSNYDGKSICSGVFGYSDRFRGEYYRCVDSLFESIENGNIITNGIICPITVLIEEVLAYLTAFSNKYKIIEILPYDLIQSCGICEVGNIKKYTHLWLNSKFNEENVRLVRNKIKRDYPKYYSFVEEYEKNYNTSQFLDIVN